MIKKNNNINKYASVDIKRSYLMIDYVTNEHSINCQLYLFIYFIEVIIV